MGAKLTYSDEESCHKALKELRMNSNSKELDLESLHEQAIGHERIISVAESDIKRLEAIQHKVHALDVCPLCQSKITEQHINHVKSESGAKITESRTALQAASEAIKELRTRREEISKELHSLKENIMLGESELAKHRSMKEKHEQIKRSVEREHDLKKELVELETRKTALEVKVLGLPKLQEHYDSKILEIEEISSRTEEDVDTTILYKERDLENIRNIIKRSKKDLEDILVEIKGLSEHFNEKHKVLVHKEEQERELNARFKKLFEQRDNLQRDIQEENLSLTEQHHSMRQIEDQTNYLKIGKAKLDAEAESVTIELGDYLDVELLQGSAAALDERLKKTQESLQQIGMINMRALEVYESVKAEYDVVYGKVQTLDKEKIDILTIIQEIDHKKKRSFMKTFKAMNQLFSENFTKLSTKGVAFLELENPEDLFAGGVNIVVKLAKGKYFDVTSLSGGEQTLVALSLLFAIQEYKPYHFYIFDEIDAALDKRNSERLAALLQQYMKSGQYIVITHNDAIIMKSNVLYGVSMHDGVSKVLSLKV